MCITYPNNRGAGFVSVKSANDLSVCSGPVDPITYVRGLKKKRTHDNRSNPIIESYAVDHLLDADFCRAKNKCCVKTVYLWEPDALGVAHRDAEEYCR